MPRPFAAPTTARRLLCLALTIAPLACASAKAQQPSGDQDAAARFAALESRYVALLDRCAAELAAEGKQASAQLVRRLSVPEIPGRTAAVLPPEDAPDLADPIDPRVVAVRKHYAKHLFEIAQTALADGDPSQVVGLLYRVLRADPDHAAARAIFDYQSTGDGRWLSAFAQRQLSKGETVEHPQFGWLPKDHVARYEAGQRPLGSRWVSVAEEDRVRGRSIDAGWNVETEHYLITTNHSLEAAVELGRRLEELHCVWRQLFAEYWYTSVDLARRFEGKPTARAIPKHKVLLFRDKDQYVAHLERDEPGIGQSLGYYAEKTRTAYFFAGDDRAIATQFHEATHQLFHERPRGRTRPAGVEENFWVVEGVATYMESLRKVDGYCLVGGAGAYRLQFARYRALTDDFYLPLAELVAIGREAMKAKGKELPLLYSQSAGLVHFLMDGREQQHRRALVRYLDAVYRDKADAAELARLTGVRYEELDREYLDFLRATDADMASLLPGEDVPRLYLGRTRVTDAAFAPIAKVAGLEQLDVGYTPVTDAAVAQLTRVESLTRLNLEHTQITDAALKHIARMTALRELDLSGCRVTDDGLAQLERLTNLEVLWLTDTPVTDAGLRRLHALKKLTSVDVGGTRVTAAGWRELVNAVPELKGS
ncbi:MAG: hypothetical protein KDA41_04685 [Planctomycetales bacterium]|nr:hypothetical protein [Planctomycetales bacterium]